MEGFKQVERSEGRMSRDPGLATPPLCVRFVIGWDHNTHPEGGLG